MTTPSLKLEVEELGAPPPSISLGGNTTGGSTGLSTPMAGMELLMKGPIGEGGNGEKITEQSAQALTDSLNEFIETPNEGASNVKSVSAPTLKIESLDEPSSGSSTKGIRIEKSSSVGDSKSGLGESVANNIKTEKKDGTWDGFRPFSGSGGPAAAGAVPETKPKMTETQILAEKFKYIRYLEALDKKPGIKVSKKYDMKSSLDEMKAEYELIKAECEKKQSMAFQGKMLMAAVTGLEFLNSKFDPFDLKLDGWGEGVHENLPEYDDVFAELHEKYKSKASVAPEIKLMFMLAGSATMVHMTNTMFKPQLPGMDDIVRHNPDLANRIAGAAAQGIVGNQPQRQAPAYSSVLNDMAAGNASGSAPMAMPPPTFTARPHNDTQRDVPPPGSTQRPPRAEMKGPENFEDIIARVKRKNAGSDDLSSVAPPPPAAPRGVKLERPVDVNAPPEERSVSLKAPTVLQGLQKAERSPLRRPENRKKSKSEGVGNVLKLDI
jgi:hypothetical protein